MKLRKLSIALLAAGALTLSACGANSEDVSKKLAEASFPDDWVKIGETVDNGSVNRVYLAPPGNTDDDLKNGSFDVVKERPIDNTSQGEFVVQEKPQVFDTGFILTLKVGKVNSIVSEINSDSSSEVELPKTAPEICELTPGGQELCDEFGIDKVQVVPVKATA